MPIDDKQKRPTVATTAPATTEPRANETSNEYTMTGDVDTDFDNIAKHYKPADLDDETWRGMWKGVLSQESNGDLSTQESTYGKLPKGKRAFGPMQVLPSTGKGLGFTPEELKDPMYNFMAGVKNIRTDWDEIGKDKRVTSPEHRAALTFAAYHAGRGNVTKSLDAGEDGVPDVDDGGINTRDYTLNKTKFLNEYLAQAGVAQSDEPQLINDEEGARTVDESGNPIDGVTQKRAGSVIVGDLTKPAPLKTFEEEIVDSDRRTREQMGLIVPSTAPRKFTGKTPTITMEVRRAEDGNLTVDENTLTDAVVFALTGDNALGQRFRQEVGENPGAFDQNITNQWLNQQVQAGNLKLSEVDGRVFVQGNVPVENYVKNRLDAYNAEGKPGVARVTSEMTEETSRYERLAAEEGYGRRVMELRAQAGNTKDEESKKKFTQQADALEAELEARYPTNWLDETWRGFKTGLARGSYNLTRTAANVKGLTEALFMSDKEKVEATKRDKRVRAMEAALESETPQARRWLGQAADAVTSELVYSPIYIGGGMMLGPSGGIMTSALRSANKPMDEALQDIAASIFELATGNLIKGKWLVGTGISPRKEFLGEMASGGFGEAGGDALIDLASGKGIDWNNALMNLVIGGGMEAGFGAREALKNAHRPEGEGEVGFNTASAGATGFDTEVRSPVFVTRGEDGQPRFGAVVRQGESFGFIEIPNQHPLILKHTVDVDEGRASFVAVDPENFETAMTDWKETSQGIKLPKLNAAQLAAYLRQENPLVTAERDNKLKSNIEGGVNEETTNEEVSANVVPTGTQQEQVVGQQGQVQTQGTDEQTGSADKGQSSDQVLTEAPTKTYRRYRSKDFDSVDHALDPDLAKQWDTAKEAYDKAYRQSAQADAEVKPGIAIKAGHVFTDARRQILKEQAKRDAEIEKAKTGVAKPKQTTTPGEKPFEAGKLVKAGSTDIRLPEDLANRWQKVQDDYKKTYEAIRDDKTLNLIERQKSSKEVNQQRVAEQNRIINEFRARETESDKRGYIKGSDRPLSIIEDRGDEVEVKLAGETATRVMGRDQIETRKERTLGRKGKTKLPISVRTKKSLGTFTEGKQASYAKDGVVYINDTTQSKIEDALDEEIAAGFTFHADKMPEVLKKLKTAGLTKIANQLEAQAQESNNKPALVNVNRDDAGLTVAHERIHQKGAGKDLPRTVVERLFQEKTAVDKLYNEIERHPIKNLNAYDGIQEILAYGLTGDYDALGVEPDVLYDALLDVVEAYIGAFPNEDLDAIFDSAIVDIDTIKNEANRRIKYGEQGKQSGGTKAVQATGDKVKAGEEGRSEADTKTKVREKERTKYGYKYGEGNVLNEIWRMASETPAYKNGRPIQVDELRDRLSDLDKKKFDTAVLNLVASGDLYLHTHDYAMSLNEADRDKLIKEKSPLKGAGQGTGDNYYVAITLTDSLGLKRETIKDAQASKEFKEWFKGSEVVNQDGNPIPLYHGSLSVIEKFDTTKLGKQTGFPSTRLGIYFSPNPEVASRYAPVVDYGNPSVYPVYVKLTNPYRMNDMELTKLDFSGKDKDDAIKDVEEFKAKLVKEGYDGIFFEKKGSNVVSEYVAFDGDQIRSVFDFKDREFITKQMATPARMGLAHTKRKEIVNKKLTNFDAVEWNKFIERAKGESLNPEEKTQLYAILQKGYQSTTEKQRLKVKEELIDFGNNLSSQNIVEFILTARKSGMLSGIKTTGRNVLSNLGFGVLEEMQRGVAGPLDLTLAKMSGTARTTQGISPTAIFKAAFGKQGAFRDGLVKFKDTMLKGNADMSNFEDIGYDPKLRPYLSVFGKKIPFATGAWFMNKTVGNFAKYVFRFQKAQDVFFRTYAYNRALYEVAALKSKNEGIPIADTLANPSAGDSDVAWRAAEVMVFQNENGMNTAYQRFKGKQPKAIKYLLDYQLPFIKTGSNIFSRTMDYLGVGGAYKLMKLSNEMTDAEWAKDKKKLWAAIEHPEARKIIVDAFSRGLVGAGIAVTGWFLAAAGMLNGMDDDDEKERNRRIAQGSGPGHLRVGDTWVDVRGVSPVGTILLSGASAWRAATKDLKDESKRYDAMLAVASSILVDGLPLARAASDYVNPKSGRSVAQRLIGAESLVPAIVAEVASAKDKLQRNTKGDTLVDTIKNSVKARIPSKREELPAKTDVFGRELEEPSPSPLVPIAGALSPKKAKDDKVVKEASDVDWSMTPPKRDTKNNETAEAFEKRKKKTQDLIYKLFDKVINDGGYSSDYTKPERKDILDEAAGIARRTIKENGKLTDPEIKDIVELVLEKAKAEMEIERDAKMDKEDKKRAKSSVSSKFSPYIGGAIKD